MIKRYNLIKNISIIFCAFLLFFSTLMPQTANAHSGSQSQDIFINAGGPEYVDLDGRIWEADTLYNTGNKYSNSNAISVTSNDFIYQSERWDSASSPELIYSVPVEPGSYEVVLHFAEIWFSEAGKRVFDVKIENKVLLKDLDIAYEVGSNTSLQKSYIVQVDDGYLDIEFVHKIENPKISAIEIHPIEALPSPEPPSEYEYRVNVGGDSYEDQNGKVWHKDSHFNTGNTYSNSKGIIGTEDDYIYQSERWDPPEGPELEYKFDLENAKYEVTLHFAEIWFDQPNQRAFDVFIEETLAQENLDITAEVGHSTIYKKSFETEVKDGQLNIVFGHVLENPKVSAIEIIRIVEQEEPHLAHAVAGPDQEIVDADEDGSEQVILDASFSHTHAFGAELVQWEWYNDNEELVSSSEVANITLPIGIHKIKLIVKDNLGNSASDSVSIKVYSPEGIPGLVSYYYNFSTQEISSIPDFSSIEPDYANIAPNIDFEKTSGEFGNTPYSDQFAAVYEGFLYAQETGEYGIAVESDDGAKLYINKDLVLKNDGIHGMTKQQTKVNLQEGLNMIRLEYFEGKGEAGLKLYWTAPGKSEEIIPAGLFSHKYSQLQPVIYNLEPDSGPLEGGNTVKIEGFGFTSGADSTYVHFGDSVFTGSQITVVNDKTIEFTALPGFEGEKVDVYVQNQTGVSKTHKYSYNSLPPVEFEFGELIKDISGPTSIAFGPDEKLYVGTQFGEIHRISFDENYQVTDTLVSNIVQESEPGFRSILGIAFNPLDDPASPKVYVSHSQLFHGQTTDFYNGKVSVVSGDKLENIQDLITGLPVSDHDHGINGLEFGLDGELYIQVGGNTNAGVPGAISSSGQQKEGALSAATLVADIQKQDFDGKITYDSQANQITGLDVRVFASGQRNPFDLTLHTNGNLYATDNGPNYGFGPESVDCNSSGADVEQPDELNLLLDGHYYGHANRKRGETDPRQCKWRAASEASDQDYQAPLATFPSSTNGITEYWTNNFSGQLRNRLIASRWQGELFLVTLNSDGTAVKDVDTLTEKGGLDVAVSWDGSVFVAQNTQDRVIYHKPVENAPGGVFVKSVFPRKGPTGGGRLVKIYGDNFPAQNLSVTLGANDCAIEEVAQNFISCVTPSVSESGAVDLTLSFDGGKYSLQKAYTYISGEGQQSQTPQPPSGEQWYSKAELPASLGELSSAAVGDYIYVIGGHDGSGSNNSHVYRYDTTKNSWQQMSDQTVVPATDHASLEVIDGKIYLFGGISSAGESNSLAVYDPEKDTWESLAPLTKDGKAYGIGSGASGVINGKLYIFGGIHNNSTVANSFVYDPKQNTWAEIAPMPAGGRNHAAAVGYNGKIYVFGGRCCGGNWPGAGSVSSFSYDPEKNIWEQLSDMPTARGGMGTAVSHGDKLYVIGGEGSGPYDGTFAAVESFSPNENSWSKHPDLPTPRHGIYPVIDSNGSIHVIGGGTKEGFSVSNVHEVLDLGKSDPGSSEPQPDPDPAPQTSTVRINAGGPAYKDNDGKEWMGDKHYNTGNTYQISTGINGTKDPFLYQSERWDPAELEELKYDVPVDSGDYTLRLHFADIYFGTHSTGARVFDIYAEGILIEDNFDIFAQVGGNYALIKEYQVNVKDTSLTIEFGHEVENPKVSAIEIIKN